jgi:hypothetical protein
LQAGTGNGMAKSLLHHAGEFFDVASATFLVIRGHKQALDVATVVQGQVRVHSILMLSWGMCVVMYLVANGVEVLRYKATSYST